RAFALVARVEHRHVLRQDFDAGALLAVLALPAARLQPALDVDLAALGEELVAGLGELVPGHDLEPLGLVLCPLPGRLVHPAGPVDSDGEVAHRRAALGVAQLRVLAEVADDHDLVKTASHSPYS